MEKKVREYFQEGLAEGRIEARLYQGCPAWYEDGEASSYVDEKDADELALWKSVSKK